MAASHSTQKQEQIPTVPRGSPRRADKLGPGLPLEEKPAPGPPAGQPLGGEPEVSSTWEGSTLRTQEASVACSPGPKWRETAQARVGEETRPAETQ